MNQTKNIAVLGCGWLGLPLAKALLETGYSVKGSTTSQNKLVLLVENKISPFLISLNENEISGNIDTFLENIETLIINIPPKLRGLVKENFVAKIETLIPYIEKAFVQKIIFVSSTSVYSDTKNNNVVTEVSSLNPDSESGKQLLEVEQILLQNKKFQTIILRFGGLVGHDRNPIKMLAGRENIENPEGKINFIHQKDCIGIILKIISSYEKENEIFNCVAPKHPNRLTYYSKKAKENNLVEPKFNTKKPSVGKLVSSEKLIEKLNYNFIVLDL